MPNQTDDTSFLGNSGAEHNPRGRQDDLTVDVCASHLDRGERPQHCFTSSKVLLDTLQSWQRQGLEDITLTWGATRRDARAQVEAQIQEAGVAYKTSRPPVSRTGPAAAGEKSGAGKPLVAWLTAIAVVVGIGLRVARMVRINQGAGRAAQEQVGRQRPNPRMMAFLPDRARTFRALQDPDARIRVQAVAVVGQQYRADKETIPALIEALKDRDPAVRRTAVITLGQIEPKPDRAVQAMRDRLADQDAGVRLAARKTLEDMK